LQVPTSERWQPIRVVHKWHQIVVYKPKRHIGWRKHTQQFSGHSVFWDFLKETIEWQTMRLIVISLFLAQLSKYII